MNKVKAGEALIDAIMLAHRADVPVMLHGPHGVGKSEILEQGAARMGIGSLVMDLSLMEPPDLAGMPEICDGRTYFRPPSALPLVGRGLLVLEELSRCQAYMRAPALQLLTARRLGDYVLPPGWLPVASVNDVEDGYHVDELDPALLSRFAHVRVEPDAAGWCEWAAAKSVHPSVIGFVRASPKVFQAPSSNPRTWSMVSKVVVAWEQSAQRDDADLVALLTGLVDDALAHAFLKVYRSRPRVPTAEEVVGDYRSWRSKVKVWVREQRLDVLNAAWSTLQAGLIGDGFRATVLADPSRSANVRTFVGDLPSDLGTAARTWLSENGFAEPERPAPRQRCRRVSRQ